MILATTLTIMTCTCVAVIWLGCWWPPHDEQLTVVALQRRLELEARFRNSPVRPAPRNDRHRSPTITRRQQPQLPDVVRRVQNSNSVQPMVIGNGRSIAIVAESFGDQIPARA